MGQVSGVFVREGDINEVCAWLRDQGERESVVVPPLEASVPWVGIFPSSRLLRPDLAQRLARAFGLALEVEREQCRVRFLRQGEAVLEIRPEGVLAGASRKESARAMAGDICRALENPRLQTKLARFLSRDEAPSAWLEGVGEVLHLPFPASSYEERMADGGWERFMWVDGGRVRGKIYSALVGTGYTSTSDMLEDTVCDLLSAGRYRATLTQLRAFDVLLGIQDGGLSCKAPSGLLTQRLREALAAHRDGLLHALAHP